MKYMCVRAVVTSRSPDEGSSFCEEPSVESTFWASMERRAGLEERKSELSSTPNGASVTLARLGVGSSLRLPPFSLFVRTLLST